MEKLYHIDFKLADFKDIIHKAKEYGYIGEILRSSVAAEILRKHGHKVGHASEIVNEVESYEDSLQGRAHQVQKENFEVCPTLKRKM